MARSVPPLSPADDCAHILCVCACVRASLSLPLYLSLSLFLSLSLSLSVEYMSRALALRSCCCASCRGGRSSPPIWLRLAVLPAVSPLSRSHSLLLALSPFSRALFFSLARSVALALARVRAFSVLGTGPSRAATRAHGDLGCTSDSSECTARSVAIPRRGCARCRD